MAGDDEHEHDEQVKRPRRAHQRAATTHERAARSEREAADTSEVFDDAQTAERRRDAARRQERDADDERHKADDERQRVDPSGACGTTACSAAMRGAALEGRHDPDSLFEARLAGGRFGGALYRRRG